jgi:hypothetical protein
MDWKSFAEYPMMNGRNFRSSCSSRTIHNGVEGIDDVNTNLQTYFTELQSNKPLI